MHFSSKRLKNVFSNEKIHFSTSLTQIADSKKAVAKKMYSATITPQRKLFSTF